MTHTFRSKNNTKSTANFHIVQAELNNIKYLKWEKEEEQVVKTKKEKRKKKSNIQQLVFAGRHRPNY